MFDELKVIRSNAQYEAYLNEIQSLISMEPKIGTPESDRLDLLAVLIEDYENNAFPIEKPNPIEAIKFRMQEKNLKQADLIPYFGTSSRVSEVLNGKRNLTVEMIKNLSLGLGISVETLIGLNDNDLYSPSSDKNLDWKKFPFKEMLKRGWVNIIEQGNSNIIEHSVKHYIEQAGLSFGTAAFRRSLSGEAESVTSKYALYAWLARIINEARSIKTKDLPKFEVDSLDLSSIRELAQLSRFNEGPLLAKQWLKEKGILLVIEPQLKGTLLDGAALKDKDGTPIIGLTLRYDRLDNFWFTLLHEIVHVWKHLDSDDAFMDDLDAVSEDRREAEANRLAAEAFIPRGVWRRSKAYTEPTDENIEILSKELKIHPAIVAGRLRKDLGNYTLFHKYIGQGEVRVMFEKLTDQI